MNRHGYATVGDARAVLGAAVSSIDDTRMWRLLEAAAEKVDDFCNRTFRIYQATQILQPDLPEQLRVPDLLSVSSLAQDTDWDGQFETQWVATDYDLLPLNAQVYQEPYTHIYAAMNGRYSFAGAFYGVHGGLPIESHSYGAYPYRPQRTQVVGKWGYWERLEDTGAALSGSPNALVTVLGVDAPGALSVGMVVKVDSEAMFIREIAPGVSPTMTVERGVNGTTAASHVAGAAISRYFPPEQVQLAAIECAQEALLAPRSGLVSSERIGDISVSYRDLTAVRASDASKLATAEAGWRGRLHDYVRVWGGV